MEMQSARTLRVRDVATRNPYCVTADMSARDLGRMLDVNEISGAAVVDTAGRLIGVVSKSDLIHRFVEELLDEGTEAIWSSWSCRRAWDEPELGVVSDFMSPEPITATLDETIAAVAGRMAEQRVHRAVVVDDEHFVIGMLTTMDLIAAIGETPRRRARRPARTRGPRAAAPLAV